MAGNDPSPAYCDPEGMKTEAIHWENDPITWFDGDTIGGEYWMCNKTQCMDEDAEAPYIEWHIVGYAADQSSVTILFNGAKTTLSRCGE